MRCLLLFISIAAMVWGNPNCPDGYTSTDQVTCYKVQYPGNQYEGSALQCQTEGASIASATNVFTNNALLTFAQENPFLTYIWLGTQCFNGSLSTCVNDDGTKFGPYSNFYPNNPSGDGNCVVMSTSGKTAGYWTSADCSFSFPYICAYPYGVVCQPGYTLFHGSCYKRKYTGGEHDAEQECKTECGEMVSIHSEAENNFVRFLAQGMYMGNNDFALVRIGLKVLPNTQNPSWLDNSPFNYSKIAYQDHDAGECFGISTSQRLVKYGEWSSINCDISIPFICKTASYTNTTSENACKLVRPSESSPFCDRIVPELFNGTGTIYSPGYPYDGISDYCYYFITSPPGTVVAYVNQVFSRTAAVRNCRNAPSGTLATIPNQEVNEHFKKLISYNSQSSYAYWIGLTCTNVQVPGNSSTCAWDDGAPVTYVSFAKGNPGTRDDSSCVIYGYGNWTSYNCNGQGVSICQAPPINF